MFAALNKSAARLNRAVNIMEVCGTHTNAIARFGLKKVLNKKINLISGPGCPVCVTSDIDLWRGINLAARRNVAICTFADMLRVPDISGNSLAAAKADGADVRVVYSPMDALDFARKTRKNVVLIAAGFETTAPAVAAVILKAAKLKLKNFFVFPMLKLINPAIKILLDGENNIDAFLLPGHVSLVLGMEPYKFIARKYKKTCVIGGFEATEIIAALEKIVNQINLGRAEIENAYPPVRAEGNAAAREIMFNVFTPYAALWRGLGRIKNSGLKIKKEFSAYDALANFKFPPPPKIKPSGCKCSAVLAGKITPEQCNLFGKKCMPQNPMGPCMVSGEGACRALYENR
ncbi:MAG: hydrogenase formation protein HypD [Elusimicrobium sp.]|jgi:hydrogenase expression/formation protein HypD|nr:hydrogenase formation protein HypD [Elusimicrobium sp.]